jgi:hypothetical protein
MSQWPKSWSRFHSAGQDGFRDTKEDLAEEIRKWVQQTTPYAGALETLVRMSRKDLNDLRFAIDEAKSKTTRQQPAENMV